MDFENWNIKNEKEINDNIRDIIKKCCIPNDVWIYHPGNNGSREEILVKLV